MRVAELRPDFMGFIFYRGSKRYAGGDFDQDILWELPSPIKKVGVFVNEKIINVLEIVARFNLDLVQLHGEETPDTCMEIRKYVPVIKAFQVDENFNEAFLKEYEAVTDYFLFDTKSKDHGGSGKKFDWKIIEGMELNKPYFLSGGIETADLENLRGLNPFAIDVNSRFETEPGLKNIENLKELLTKTKDHEIQC